MSESSKDQLRILLRHIVSTDNIKFHHILNSFSLDKEDKNMIKHFIAITLTLIASLNLHAQTKATEENIQPTMHKIFNNMQELFPYMTDEEKFIDPKNDKFIGDKLKESALLIKNAKHSKELKSSTLKISREVLESHFMEIDRIFRLGNKSFARWQLNSTVPLCMNCHTQSPSQSRHWDLAELTRSSTSNFNKAELLFMGRDFDAALKMYNEIIRGFPANKARIMDVEKSFERKLVIFARVQRDFKEGMKSLDTDIKENKKLPEYLVKNVNAWTALFRIQLREGFPDPTKSNDAAMKKYVNTELKNNLWDDMIDATNPRLVKNLTISGVLYEYLNTNPQTKIKPDILYWLAVIDKQLQDTLFYSLSDLYLKQCMSEFTTHPTAKKCFEQYKTNAILSYSGSSGTHLPGDIKKELKDWSMRIYGTDKSDVE